MNKPPFIISVFWLLVAPVVFTPPAIFAESIRRTDSLERGLATLENGDAAMKARDYEKAVASFKQACDLIPNDKDSKAAYDRAVDSFSQASCRLAEMRINEGRSADAQQLLNLVLEERYNPRCEEARKLLAQLEEPDLFSKPSELKPPTRIDLERVKQLLIEAQGYYDADRYDLAFRRCEQVLAIDPFNTTARTLKKHLELARGSRKTEEGGEETPAVMAPPATGAQALESGDRALRTGEYEKATAYYRQACDLIPNTEDTRVVYQSALVSFGKASCLFAEQRIIEGRYADARKALQVVLDERYDPRCKAAIKLLAELDEPASGKADVRSQVRNGEKVRQLLTEAQSYYVTARYNLAIKRCEEILVIEPYNAAARALQKKCESGKEALDLRDPLWETP
jgi:tetratricopeptide (TPR) repeat protein